MTKLSAVIIICCIGITVYSNTLLSPFHFDDYKSIVENQNIRNLSRVEDVLKYTRGRFVAYLSFAVNYRINRLDVFGYHLFNIFIHIASAILVWWLTLMTFSTPLMKDRSISRRGAMVALMAGLIFVSHPMQTSAVTYISQRMASLATFFYLAALCLYVKFRLSQGQNASSKTGMPYLVGFFITALLGVFTKEIVITLPLMILLYELCFFGGRKGFRRKAILAAAFLIIIAIVMFINIANSLVLSGTNNIAGQGRAPLQLVQYILTQERAVLTYFRMFLVPVNQNIDYDYPAVTNIMDPSLLVTTLILILIIFASYKAYPKYRLLAFGIFWFFLSLSPEYIIAPVYMFVSGRARDAVFEHRLYLAMAGGSIFLASGVYYLFEKRPVKVMIAAYLIIIAGYSTLAYSRNDVWKSDLALWEDAISKSPKKARPYNNRGVALAAIGDLDRAISDFTKVIGIDPMYADAYYNRARAYHKKGDFEKAISDYTKTINIDSKYYKAYNNRGILYSMSGKYDSAISDYKSAMSDSTAGDVFINMAVSYFYMGEYGKSMDCVRAAQKLGGAPDPLFVKKLNQEYYVWKDNY